MKNIIYCILSIIIVLLIILLIWYILYKIINKHNKNNKVDNKLHNRINNKLHNKIDNRINNKIDNRVDNRLDNRLDNRIDNKVDNKVDNRLDNKVDNKLNNFNISCSNCSYNSSKSKNNVSFSFFPYYIYWDTNINNYVYNNDSPDKINTFYNDLKTFYYNTLPGTEALSLLIPGIQGAIINKLPFYRDTVFPNNLNTDGSRYITNIICTKPHDDNCDLNGTNSNYPNVKLDGIQVMKSCIGNQYFITNNSGQYDTNYTFNNLIINKSSTTINNEIGNLQYTPTMKYLMYDDLYKNNVDNNYNVIYSSYCDFSEINQYQCIENLQVMQQVSNYFTFIPVTATAPNNNIIIYYYIKVYEQLGDTYYLCHKIDSGNQSFRGQVLVLQNNMSDSEQFSRAWAFSSSINYGCHIVPLREARDIPGKWDSTLQVDSSLYVTEQTNNILNGGNLTNYLPIYKNNSILLINNPNRNILTYFTAEYTDNDNNNCKYYNTIATTRNDSFAYNITDINSPDSTINNDTNLFFNNVVMAFCIQNIT